MSVSKKERSIKEEAIKLRVKVCNNCNLKQKITATVSTNFLHRNPHSTKVEVMCIASEGELIKPPQVKVVSDCSRYIAYRRKEKRNEEKRSGSSPFEINATAI